MRAIPTEYVENGTILGEDLYTSDGRMLLKSGMKLNDSILKKINEHNVYTIYIEDVHSDSKVERLLDQSLRVKGILLIKKLFDAAVSKKDILSLHNELSAYADDVLYEINSIKHKQIEYIDIKHVDIYVYSSALNVALMSALVAWDLKISNEMIKHIFLGGIYHDLGIAMLPENVSNKSTELTIDEKMMILMHPVSGHSFLKDKIFISAYIKAITLHHHEHVDGTGYPNRVSGKDINKFAQIIGIVDVYDAMTSDRPYRRSVSSKEAIEYIMGAAGTHFDFEIASAFIKKVNPYPRGSLIELTDGRYAVVDEVPKNLPLRPVIRLIERDGDSYKYEEMDLRLHPNVVVKGIVYKLEF